jgi:hypothetical protein
VRQIPEWCEPSACRLFGNEQARTLFSYARLAKFRVDAIGLHSFGPFDPHKAVSAYRNNPWLRVAVDRIARAKFHLQPENADGEIEIIKSS